MKKRWILPLAIAGLAFAGAAQAQCVTINNATVPGSFNPFSASGLDQTMTLTIHRSLLGAREGNIVFIRRPGDNRDYDVRLVSDDGTGAGGSILYYPPGPTLSTGNNDPGEMDLSFALFGTVRTSQVRFIAPALSDIPAGSINLVLDVKYLCEELIGQSSGTTPSGFSLTLNVLSALQASFVGSSLDFTEIGSLSTAQLPAAPDSVKRVTGSLRVASSGPYEVRATSQNGWTMTPNGGAASQANQKIGYEFSLVGRTARPGNNFAPKICSWATVTGKYLPVAVTLLEGGVGKSPSPTYQDTVTVTFTPLGATTPAPEACP